MRAPRAIAALLTALAIGGCSSPLPEAGTPAAELYAQRCGTCHRAYQPKLMTPKMWEAMVARMAVEMDRRGVGLQPQEKADILSYLERNAAGK